MDLEDFDEDLSDEEKEFFFAASETAELLKTLNLRSLYVDIGYDVFYSNGH